MREHGDMPAAMTYVVRDLHKRYRGELEPANDGIDLDICSGEVFGLLGPNGAGKTTLVRQLVGLATPDSGTLRLFGHDLADQPALAAGWVAYLAQDEPALAELPMRLAVETTGRLRGLSRHEAKRATGTILDELSLGSLADRPLLRLSGGQRRLGALASALAANRPVLVLDEPTTGLDPVARRSVWSALRRRCDEQGTTVILVTHNVLEAESVLDRVAVLDRGRVIACDRPADLVAAVDAAVRLDVTWRHEPSRDDPTVAELAAAAVVEGRRWSSRLPRDAARLALSRLMSGALLETVDDVTVTAPSLEDVYLALGGRSDDLERT